MKEDEFFSHPVIIFDGYCNLCSSLIKFIIKNDKNVKFRFLSFQIDAYKNLLQNYQSLPEKPETVILIYQFSIYERSSAVLKIFNLLGFPWALLSAGNIFPERFRDYVYNVIAVKRYSIFGKRNSCYIPIKRNN